MLLRIGLYLRYIALGSIIFLWMTLLAIAHPIDMQAIAQIESSNNPNAISKDGSFGLYQITPICLKHFNSVFKEKWQEKYFKQKYPALEMKDMINPELNALVANWYMNWLFDRCWTIKDTLIAWNWGIGNWRKWKNGGNEYECTKIPHDTCILKRFQSLPKTTQAYLKEYEKLTGDKLDD